MKNATVFDPDLKLNEFELIRACDDFEKSTPNRLYNVYPGNDCIWINCGPLNVYYIFRDGQIVDVQVD
jgi:hypothetical protein